MEVSISMLPICHCHVSPTVGRHHEEEDVEAKGISMVGESGSDEGEAGSHPTRKDERRKRVRKSLNHMMFELRQVILMLCKEFVGHLADLGERQHSGSKWVMRDRAINHRRVAFDGCSDRHLFDAAGELRKQGTFSGERADMNGMEAGFVNDDRNFDTRTFGKIRDELGVADIAVELEHLAASESIDDVRGVLMFALQVFGRKRLSELFFDLVLPRGFVVLIFLENVRVF